MSEAAIDIITNFFQKHTRQKRLTSCDFARKIVELLKKNDLVLVSEKVAKDIEETRKSSVNNYSRIWSLENKLLAPIELIIHCPECKGRHIDEGEFADKVHHTHSCQHCGFTWRPAKQPTKGVQFLKGFKNV